MLVNMSGESAPVATLAKAVPVLLGPGHGLPLVAAGVGLLLLRSSRRVAEQRRLDHAQAQNLGR
jgi:hypothetical protein